MAHVGVNPSRGPLPRSIGSGRGLRLVSCVGALGLINAAAWSCGTPAPPAPSAPVVAPTDVADTDPAPPVELPQGFSGSSRVIEARGQSLTFPLPDAAGWRRDRGETRSWVASHPATTSRLVVRAWQHDAIARIEDCERQARLWRPELAVLGPEALVEAKRVTLAGSYTSEVSVGILADDPATPDALHGHALAFGSDARRCLMLAFSTAASGPGALRVVAERLGIISEAVFGGLRRLEIDARVVVPRL